MDSIWKASILLFLLIQQYKLAEHITKQTQQDTAVLHSRAADHCSKQCPPLQALGLYSHSPATGSCHQGTGTTAEKGEAQIGSPGLFWWVMCMSWGLCNTIFFEHLSWERRTVCLSCLCSLQGKRSWMKRAFLVEKPSWSRLLVRGKDNVTRSTENYSREALGSVNSRNRRGSGRAERRWLRKSLQNCPRDFSILEKCRKKQSAAKDGKGKRSVWRLLSSAVKPSDFTAETSLREWYHLAAEPNLKDCWYQNDASASSPAAFFVRVWCLSDSLMSSCSSVNCKKMNSVKNIPAQERRRIGHCENGDCNEWEKYKHQNFSARLGCFGGCLAPGSCLTSYFTS